MGTSVHYMHIVDIHVKMAILSKEVRYRPIHVHQFVEPLKR